MQQLKVDLKSCYGIRELQHVFDFSEKNQYVIYAPNGVMKSSLAKTFQDYSKKLKSNDRVFPEREYIRIIEMEDGVELPRDEVFVIDPYNADYESEKVSTLLANKRLREQYQSVYEAIEEKKESLFKLISKHSGIRKTDKIEELIAKDFTQDSKEIWTALMRVQAEVQENKHSYLTELAYGRIFTEKVITLLTSDEFREKISDYMQVYDQLTTNSNFFRKGVFNHNQASDIAKNLKANGFFEAQHSVFLNSNEVKEEITTEDALIDVIQKEKEAILENDDLRASFDELDKALTKNADLRGFRDYLESHEEIIPELVSPDRLRQRLWVSYLARESSLYFELMEVYTEGKKSLDGILKEAKKETPQWARVIELFNSRFSVPFQVYVGNPEDVILRSDTPSIQFRFEDDSGEGAKNIEKDKLLQVLSNGERRALYILNIIFEIEARRSVSQNTLFVIDDIADSFDYKNKYAIVEYLRDISSEGYFTQLILTHNFDFFRTISGRLDLARSNKLHCVKTKEKIQLVEEKYQNNPFKHWKNRIHTEDNELFLVAMIPFVRNLAEYLGMKPEEEGLTSYLHIKENTSGLKLSDLLQIFNSILQYPTPITFADDERLVLDLVYQLASDASKKSQEEMDLEVKILLSVATRLKVEEYLIAKISDPSWVAAISKNQTYQLIEKFIELYPDSVNEIAFLRKVNLMTPENIHVNSFMYEPILDMSNEHLKKLYTDACALS